MGEAPLQRKDEEVFPAVRRQWRTRRLGRAVMVAVVVAGLLGLFSQGPISSARTTAPADTFVVSYERFDRRGGTSEIAVEIDAAAVEGRTVTVFLGGDLLDHIRISSISPTPVTVAASGAGNIYEFEVEQPREPVEAVFSITPRGLGLESGTIGLGDERVTFRQFLYP